MEGLKREEFEKLKKMEIFRGNIVSDSMVPKINIGDKIVVDVGNLNLQRFDIIVFYGQDKLMCHYLWSMNRKVEPILFQARSLKYGDKDLPIGFDDYLGKVISHKLSTWDKIRIFLSLKVKGKSI